MSRRERRRGQRRRRHASRTARRRVAAGAGLSLGAALGIGAGAEAASFTVTSLADDGSGGTTLREALQGAQDNDNPGVVDQVLFRAGLSGRITLGGSQLPTIDEPLSLSGPGASALTVSGGNASRILFIDTEPGHDVTVSGLSLTGGNAAANGGALYARDADLTIRGAVVSGNRSAGEGGGMYLRLATALIERSTVSGNSAPTPYSSGGGIRTGFTATTIRRSTISGNSVVGGGDGGGVFAHTGETAIESSTISGNSATGAFAHAGGVYTYGGSLSLDSSTISRNSGTESGGVRHLGASPPTVTDTIVAGNLASSGAPDLFGDGTSFELAFTLIGNVSGASITETVPGSNLLGVAPGLGALARNGGPTRTHAPRPTSPALDKGSAAGTDQRRGPRPFDFLGVANSGAAGANGADIGAFELRAPRCAGKRPTIPPRVGKAQGSARGDVIVGTPGRNVIRARGGNDTVCGLGGNDILLGGPGRDRLLGQGGRDALRGGPGRDRLVGGKGRDRLLGGAGRDVLRGGPGRDRQRQ